MEDYDRLIVLRCHNVNIFCISHSICWSVWLKTKGAIPEVSYVFLTVTHSVLFIQRLTAASTALVRHSRKSPSRFFCFFKFSTLVHIHWPERSLLAASGRLSHAVRVFSSLCVCVIREQLDRHSVAGCCGFSPRRPLCLVL